MKSYKFLPGIIVLAVMLGMVSLVNAGGMIATPSTDYMYCQNISDQTMYDGEVVFWATAATVTGYEVTHCNGASTSLVAGIVVGTIYNNAYGNIQIAGYHDSVKVDTFERPIAVGDKLIPTSHYGTLESAENKEGGFFVSLEAEDRAPRPWGNSSTCPTVRAIIRLGSQLN